MKKNYLSIGLLTTAMFLGFQLKTNAQTATEKQKQIKKITGKYNLTKLKSLENSLKQKAVLNKQKVQEYILKHKIKKTVTTKDGRFMELQKIVDGKPLYYTTFNLAAARSTRTDHIKSGGSLGLNLVGQNMTAFVWDGGVANRNHQEYDGPGGSNRVTNVDNSGFNFHAEHVTGTIIASGFVSDAEGMAPQAKVNGYNWTDDEQEVVAAAANDDMIISNHSYGYATRDEFDNVLIPARWFGTYIEAARIWDEILFDAPGYLMVVAAGNDGADNTANSNPNFGSSWDKLTGHAVSKNTLVVANAQDANVSANGNLISVSINNTSSEGPTDDLRIKPDITGNGTNVYSSFNFASYDATVGTNFADGNISDDYASISGTSMASPNVTGSLLLVQQHYSNLNGSFMKAATLKGLALHTADDAGVSGPDAVFGWGLLNAKAAAETVTKKGNESKIEELTLMDGQSYSITVDSDGVNPLLASISWTDRAGTAINTTNSSSTVLVNDLDVRVTKGGTTYFPYELTGPNTNALQDNDRDPFERIDVSSASGTYTITVTHKGSLVGGSQNFSLVVTGLTGTPIVCNATVPTNLASSNVSETGATISWDTVPTASYDVRYRVSGTSSWTVESASTASLVLSGLNGVTTYDVQVRSKCSDGDSAYSSTINFTTTDIQLNYCSSNGNDVSDEFIGRFQMGSIDNSTGASSSGYADYTSLSTDISKGSSVNFTITPTWTGTIYDEGYAVFIDFNQDGDFDDANESVFTAAPSKTTPINGTFNVPSSATDGNTRMRVILAYDSTPSSCGANNYGETEDYTVNITGSTTDTEAPTAPTNLVASNVAETTASLSWDASSDNVGVTGYNVYQGSTNIGTVTGTGANITDLIANTTYTFSVTAVDAEGNESNSDSVTFTTTGGSTGGSTTVVHEGFFETSDLDGWTDGGNDCFWYSNNSARVYEGSYAMRLRDNSGTASSMTSPVFNLSNFDSVEFSFYFYANSMETGEDFWVRYYDGSSWQTIATYVSGTDFNNRSFYSATLTLDSSNFTFASNAQFRVQSDADANNDQVYIDQVVVKGIIGNGGQSTNSITAISGNSSFNTGNNYFIGDNMIYPNPAKDILNINTGFGEIKSNFRITNLLGQVILSGKINSNSINVSSLKKGIYLLELTDEEETFTTKFVKQ